MNLFLETIVFLVKFIWLWLLGVYKALMPASLQPQKAISGWTVLISGSGSGIGRLLALRFAALGCRVVLWDMNQAENEKTAHLLRQAALGAQATTYTVDLSNRDQVYRIAGQVKDDVGDVDILVNNAGIVTGRKLLDTSDTADALMVKTMEVNSISHFWTVKAFLPAMLQRNRGHVVTISSSAGLFGASGLVDYCSSKFAAFGFAESLRLELAKQKKDGIKTTVVCPGFIDTGMFEGFKYRFPILMPILEPPYVADKIIEAVLIDQAWLCLPRSAYLMYYLKGLLPVNATDALGEFMGILDLMDEFKGRKKD
ncbi:hypothetical protein RRG08_060269 [Elysia crispata]|uniref:Ketoreductase domain-containing protein n=1 Tax=Elysia crispata TaxID=231223 RepID=A0AAE1EAX8_9GAST|nr:hypothetical protein RRG08_060269 [Elysia crispata]